jgi:hypothetical protein
MRPPVLLALFCAAAAIGDEPRIEKLSWMSGCWVLTRGNTVIEEQWSKPAAGNMLGFSRTLRDGRMVMHEYLRIEQAGGQFRYLAHIGSRVTPFALAKMSEAEVEFANPAHDFPQVIRYRRVPADEMHARIEGSVKGKTRGQDIPMKRVACP